LHRKQHHSGSVLLLVHKDFLLQFIGLLNIFLNKTTCYRKLRLIAENYRHKPDI